MKDGEQLLCKLCNSNTWTLMPATFQPHQPKQFLVGGYTNVNIIPGKSYCYCANCGYMLPDMIDTPKTVDINFIVNLKK